MKQSEDVRASPGEHWGLWRSHLLYSWDLLVREVVEMILLPELPLTPPLNPKPLPQPEPKPLPRPNPPPMFNPPPMPPVLMLPPTTAAGEAKDS